jgi:hypothetical protein
MTRQAMGSADRDTSRIFLRRRWSRQKLRLWPVAAGCAGSETALFH